MLPIVTTSTPVASVVTTMKISSLIERRPAVVLSRTLHRSATSAPRAIGPDQQDAEVGHVVGGHAERGAEQAT